MTTPIVQNVYLHIKNFLLAKGSVRVLCNKFNVKMGARRHIKGSFFLESAMCLSNLQNLNPLSIIVNNLFKCQAQDSDLEYLFWRFEKHITPSEKKSPLVTHVLTLRGLA